MGSKAQELRKSLRGVVIAMITPIHDDYSLNLERLQDNVQKAMDAGIVNGRGGFIIGGGGGHFNRRILPKSPVTQGVAIAV